MSNEVWRLAAVIDVMVIFGAGLYLHLGMVRLVPYMRRPGYALGAFFLLVALAVVANWLSPVPPTIGVKIFAVGAAAIAIYLVTACVQLARGRL